MLRKFLILLHIGFVRTCDDNIVQEVQAAFLRDASRYTNASKLEEYLRENGLLITMCTQSAAAACDEEMDHISASWINNVWTGYRLYPANYGAILNLDNVIVKCAYPTDASTDARDNQGCGPHTMDPVYGSKGYDSASRTQRQETQEQIEALYASLNISFWWQLPCSALIPQVYELNAVYTISGQLESYYYYVNEFYKPFLNGQPLCRDDNPLCVKSGSCGALDFLGNYSWSPQQFALAIDTQRSLFDWNPPLLKSSWNEIIVEPNISTSASVYRAVFWHNDTRLTQQERNSARIQAHRLAQNSASLEQKQLPVLVANFPWLLLDPNATASPWFENATLAADNPGVIFSCD